MWPVLLWCLGYRCYPLKKHQQLETCHASVTTKICTPSMHQCQLGVVAYLWFQPWKAELGSRRVSWLVRLAVSVNSGFDWETLPQRVRIEVRSRMVPGSTLALHIHIRVHAATTCIQHAHTDTEVEKERKPRVWNHPGVGPQDQFEVAFPPMPGGAPAAEVCMASRVLQVWK